MMQQSLDARRALWEQRARGSGGGGRPAPGPGTPADGVAAADGSTATCPALYDRDGRRHDVRRADEPASSDPPSPGPTAPQNQGAGGSTPPPLHAAPRQHGQGMAASAVPAGGGGVSPAPPLPQVKDNAAASARTPPLSASNPAAAMASPLPGRHNDLQPRQHERPPAAVQQDVQDGYGAAETVGEAGPAGSPSQQAAPPVGVAYARMRVRAGGVG